MLQNCTFIKWNTCWHWAQVASCEGKCWHPSTTATTTAELSTTLAVPTVAVCSSCASVSFFFFFFCSGKMCLSFFMCTWHQWHHRGSRRVCHFVSHTSTQGLISRRQPSLRNQTGQGKLMFIMCYICLIGVSFTSLHLLTQTRPRLCMPQIACIVSPKPRGMASHKHAERQMTAIQNVREAHEIQW